MEKRADKKRSSREKNEKPEKTFSRKKEVKTTSRKKEDREQSFDKRPRRDSDERSFDRESRGRSSERSFDRKPRRDSDDRGFDKESRGRSNERSFDRKPRRDDDRRPRRDSGERSFDKDSRGRSSERSFDRKPRRDDDRRPRRDSGDRSFDKDSRGRSSERSFDRKPWRDDDRKPRRDSGERSFDKDSRGRSSERSFDRKPWKDDDRRPRRSRDDESYSRGSRRNEDFSERPRRRRDVTAESEILSEIVAKRKREGRQSPQRQKILSLEYEEQYGPIRLNKYISNSGICSRREADTLIETGTITVNGKIVTELGMKVMPTDEVRFGDKVLQREKPVYILLNKPKDYITTTEDERDRKHVMQLIKGACKERVYPVGRLDRNTTGLLLFTNDGELTKKLTHPKHGIRKMYHVELDKNLSGSDFETIVNGIELDDGIIKPDEIAYLEGSKRELGITIHSGKNRIVRRIFESLGYEIVKLDRVVFAGLTKKDIPRGRWRFLTQAEINILRMSL